MVKSLLEKFWQFITKLTTYVLYDPQILLLSIYPSEMKKDLFGILHNECYKNQPLNQQPQQQ